MYNFVNPYNFIPFSEDSPTAKSKTEVYRGEKRQKELLSGWLDVSIYTKTPLIIPDGAHPKYLDLKENKYVDKKQYISGKNDDAKKRNTHYEYDFLRLYNPKTEKMEYAVSGSELRGLIRSTYESLTNSCVPFLMNDKPMSQRVPLYGALNRRGLLEYDGKRWVLYSTTKKLEEVFVIPLYEAGGKYYIESLDGIRNNKDNNKLDSDGNLKYEIMSQLDLIENSLKNYKWKGSQVIGNAKFGKTNKGKCDIELPGQVIKDVNKKIVHYIFVDANGIVIEDSTGTYEDGKGWLQYNVPVDTSRVYHIAYLTKGKEEYRWPDSSAEGNENRTKQEDTLYAEAYKKLKSALDRDGASGKNTNNECNNALKNALRTACKDSSKLVPVYYFTVNDDDKKIVYLSGSAAGRIAQRRKWEDIMHGHKPCEKELCPACMMFGTIKDGGMKSHLRFTDAFMTEPEKAKISKHTLKVLASPRTTAFEFYLRKPAEDATYWNYDFYGITEGEDTEGSHTNYYHLDRAMPRGRKMYWHHKPAADDDKKTNLNNTMESLDYGEFSFKIYFDQISKEQLQDLIWSVELGDNRQNSKFQHKLGHAKPLGYGSIKLVVNDGKIRDFYHSGEGKNFGFKVKKLAEVGVDVNNIEPSFDMESKSVKSLLIMANSETVAAENVHYPRMKSGSYIYEWFSENRKNPKTLMILPEPDAKKLSFGEKRKPLKEGDIVEAKFDGYAEKREDNYIFGIYVRMPGGEKALLHRKSAKNRNLDDYDGKIFKVKIEDIKNNRGRKQYSVTDKI